MDLLKIIVKILLIIGLIMMLYLLPYRIVKVESNSMLTALSNHDFIIVKKLLDGNRIFGKNDSIERNSIVLFQQPFNRSKLLIKRCVGMPGESIRICNGKVLINNQLTIEPNTVVRAYRIYFDLANLRKVDSLLKIYPNGIGSSLADTRAYKYDKNGIKAICESEYIDSVVEYINPNPIEGLEIFLEEKFWTKDNWGPVTIPKKGSEIVLTSMNFGFYSQIISEHEGRDLELIDNQVYIDGQHKNEYTFEQDYYFVLGDNRNTSVDSRSFSFVPHTLLMARYIKTLHSRHSNR